MTSTPTFNELSREKPSSHSLKYFARQSTMQFFIVLKAWIKPWRKMSLLGIPTSSIIVAAAAPLSPLSSLASYEPLLGFTSTRRCD
jgi:hypothetical protein